MRRFEFLYQSLADAQATIRATDAKLGFLFAVIFLPVFAANEIFSSVKEMSECSSYYMAAAVLISMLWLSSLYTLFMGLTPLYNPAAVVLGNESEGVFYNGNTIRLGFVDVFYNRNLKSKKSPKEISAMLPIEDDKIIEELVFEKIKLSYIRDIKLKRTSWCIKLSFSWVVFSSMVYAIHFFGVFL